MYLCTGKAWYLCTGKTRLLSIVEVPRAHPPTLPGEHIPALKKFFGILLVCQLVPRFFSQAALYLVFYFPISYSGTPSRETHKEDTYIFRDKISPKSHNLKEK